ncbi:MAG: 50S ribosomal protein L9 [Parcubacteria group bacterium]
MKIILIKNVSKLGKAGEIKEVPEGYGRNFLLPQGLAMIATEKNLRIRKQEEMSAASNDKKKAEAPDQLVQKLKTVILNFDEKADGKDTFFAGITKEKIVQALRKRNIPLKPKQIALEKPIKKPGDYNINVELPGGLKGEFRVIAKKISA